MACAFFSFGMITYIDATSHKTLYIFASMLSRLCQGVGSVFIQVTCYSVATNFYPENKTKIIGTLDAMVGLGVILGPTLGTLLFSIGGFRFM